MKLFVVVVVAALSAQTVKADGKTLCDITVEPEQGQQATESIKQRMTRQEATKIVEDLFKERRKVIEIQVVFTGTGIFLTGQF